MSWRRNSVYIITVWVKNLRIEFHKWLSFSNSICLVELPLGRNYLDEDTISWDESFLNWILRKRFLLSKEVRIKNPCGEGIYWFNPLDVDYKLATVTWVFLADSRYMLFRSHIFCARCDSIKIELAFNI